MLSSGDRPSIHDAIVLAVGITPDTHRKDPEMPRPVPSRTRTRSRRIALPLLTLILAAAAVAGAAWSDRDREPIAGPAPGTAGMRVAIDPETGELGLPDAAALEADLAGMLSRSDAGLEVVVHPDGRKSVDLQGRFMDMTVVHRDAGGNLHATCTHDLATAKDVLAGCTSHAPTGPEVQ